MEAGPTLVRGSAQAYGAAAIIVAAAIGIRLASGGLIVGYPFITIFPAVVLSAYVGGYGPGLFAVAAGGAAAWYLLVPEVHTYHLETASDRVGLALFVGAATFMVWVMASLEAALTRERAAKARLEATLEEKDELLRERELLLTEIRHRVGNNLQQITGLLLLHARRLRDPAARDAFENATQRINLFAEVHQSLYGSGPDKAGLKPLLEKVTTYLVSAYRPVGISCRLEVAPGFVYGPEKAVPIVMVVHELVCNAIEHGFGDDKTGSIAVVMERTETGLVRLMVSDDGQGLPPGFDASSSDSLGLSIVRAFARQLNGSFGLYPGEGGRGSVAELVFDDGQHPRRDLPQGGSQNLAA